MTDHAWTQRLKPIKGVKGSWGRYLSRAERQGLVEHARWDPQPFLRALAGLSLRVGALAALHVSDYNKRNKLLTMRTDRAGAGRTITLPATAVTMIEHAARRELRWRAPGRGKRGGCRVIHFLRNAQAQIVLALLYAKNVRENVEPGLLRELKENFKPWPR